LPASLMLCCQGYWWAFLEWTRNSWGLDAGEWHMLGTTPPWEGWSFIRGIVVWGYTGR